jgi:hypothetical protein
LQRADEYAGDGAEKSADQDFAGDQDCHHSLYRHLSFRNRGDDLADVGAVDNTGNGELFASLADILGFLDGALDQIGEFASRRAALGLDALGASRSVPAPRKGDKGFFN